MNFKTRLTEQSLNVMLIPLVSVLFFGGVELIELLPGVPLFPRLWTAMWPGTEPPTYLSEVGGIIAGISILVSVLKYIAADRWVESLHIGSGVVDVFHADRESILLWLIGVSGIILLTGYPVTFASLWHAGILLMIQIAITVIPSVVAPWFPDSTGRLTTKLQVAAVIFLGVFLVVATGTLGMQWVSYLV